MAVLRAEIQILTRKSSTPSLLAINIPPPTVTIQTGHWADTGGAKNKKQKTRKRKNVMEYFNKNIMTTTGVVND